MSSALEQLDAAKAALDNAESREDAVRESGDAVKIDVAAARRVDAEWDYLMAQDFLRECSE